jgi:hypothetical protein
VKGIQVFSRERAKTSSKERCNHKNAQIGGGWVFIRWLISFKLGLGTNLGKHNSSWTRRGHKRENLLYVYIYIC